MACRTLLAYFADENDLEDALPVAKALAERHRSHLIGLHSIPPIDIPPYYGGPVTIFEDVRVHQEALARLLGVRFEAATKGGDIVAEWRTVDARAAGVEHAVAEQGNTADLVIVARTRDASRRGSRAEPMSRVLAASGRPVLVVPRERRATSVGERVFVAWNGDRAATRALFGALPILRRAQSVRLQRMNVPERDGRRAFGTTEALAEALARHEVRVEVFHADARNAEIGRDLLGFAGDWGADLLISGCQETGAVREMVFGSTTRHLLEHAQMPLLMSS